MKIRNSVFSIGRNFGSIDRNSKKIILEFLDGSITIRFLFDQSKRAFDRSKRAFDRSKGPLGRLKLEKIEFFAEFFGNCSERLKMFQVL